MPRPQRCRKICNKPRFTDFSPSSAGCAGCTKRAFQAPEAEEDCVSLTLDEFEVIRLVDLEKRTHEQCAAQMEISRSTVTEIYESARQKIADSLVNGRRLVIGGGNYRLCSGYSEQCFSKHCEKRRAVTNIKSVKSRKDSNIMKIAVTYENGEIFQHFGHTEQFKIYEAEDGKILSSEIVDTNGSGHGALAGFLAAHNVSVLICGGIGGGAQTALAEAGIQLFGGASGSADEAVNALLNESLKFNPDVHCNHHGEDHSCGEHGCGSHGCH